MDLLLAMLPGAPFNVIILVLVLVNHYKVRDLCRAIRKESERLDKHLESHARPE